MDQRLAERKAALEGRVASRFGGVAASGVAQRAMPGAPAPLGAASPARGAGRAVGEKYGVFVGVNHTPAGNELMGCVNDANDLRDACVELGGWKRQNTVVLEDASGAELLDALSRFASVARPGDVVAISFSGHGAAFGSNPGNDFVFAMNDGLLQEKDFCRALSAFGAGIKVVVVVDACCSGAAFDAGALDRYRLPNVGWITASTSYQTSDDAFQGDRRNGFLTGAILEGWRKGGALGMADQAKGAAAAREAGNEISFLDLAVFVAHSWRYWHPTCQQPQYSNPAVLGAVSAGVAGSEPAGSRGAAAPSGGKTTYRLYCQGCGREWSSDHWDDYCPTWGCNGPVKRK